MGEEQIAIDVDGDAVRGILHVPEDTPAPLVVMCHGWKGSCTGPDRFFVTAARRFTAEGFAVCRFDFRGTGNSDMAFREQTFTTMLTDLEAVVSAVQGRPETGETVVLIGHSLGAAIALLHASRNDGIDGVVSWMGRTYDMEDAYGQQWQDDLERRGYTLYDGGRFHRKLAEDAETYEMTDAIARIAAPIAGIYGELDNHVPPSEGHHLKEHATVPVDIEIREYLDHLFHGEENREAVIDQTLAWLDAWV